MKGALKMNKRNIARRCFFNLMNLGGSNLQQKSVWLLTTIYHSFNIYMYFTPNLFTLPCQTERIMVC
jgi:hypothetical protein